MKLIAADLSEQALVDFVHSVPFVRIGAGYSRQPGLASAVGCHGHLPTVAPTFPSAKQMPNKYEIGCLREVFSGHMPTYTTYIIDRQANRIDEANLHGG